MNVRLKGLASAKPLAGDIKFQIEFRTEDGGVMVIERTMTNNTDTVMNLN